MVTLADTAHRTNIYHLSHPYCYQYQLGGKRKSTNQKKDDSHNISSKCTKNMKPWNTHRCCSSKLCFIYLRVIQNDEGWVSGGEGQSIIIMWRTVHSSVKPVKLAWQRFRRDELADYVIVSWTPCIFVTRIQSPCIFVMDCNILFTNTWRWIKLSCSRGDLASANIKTFISWICYTPINPQQYNWKMTILEPKHLTWRCSMRFTRCQGQ